MWGRLGDSSLPNMPAHCPLRLPAPSRPPSRGTGPEPPASSGLSTCVGPLEQGRLTPPCPQAHGLPEVLLRAAAQAGRPGLRPRGSGCECGPQPPCPPPCGHSLQDSTWTLPPHTHTPTEAPHLVRKAAAGDGLWLREAWEACWRKWPWRGPEEGEASPAGRRGVGVQSSGSAQPVQRPDQAGSPGPLGFC